MPRRLVDVNDLITQTEAAEMCGVSRTTIHNFVNRGALDSVEIGGKMFVFRRQVQALKIDGKVRKVRTDAELLGDVLRVERELGRPPNSAEYKRHGRVHLSSVCRRFGDWAGVIEAARKHKGKGLG